MKRTAMKPTVANNISWILFSLMPSRRSWSLLSLGWWLQFWYGDLNLAETRTMTVIDYKGYRIEVGPLGKGWRASIFSPGSTTPWPNSPTNLEKSSSEAIVAEAKRIIEVRLGPRLL